MISLFKTLRSRIARSTRLLGQLQTLGLPSCPVAFLGISEHIKQESLAPPIGATTLFRLGVSKAQYFYPAPIGTYTWLFLVDTLSLPLHGSCLEISIGRAGAVDYVGSFRLALSSEASTGGASPLPATNELLTFDLPHQRWILVPAQIPDAVVPEPSSPTVVARFGASDLPLGQVHFRYVRRPPFTASEIRAINADPRAVRFARIELGCKHCDSKYRVYTALDRVPEMEKDGYVWQHSVAEAFHCACGSTKLSLQYVRESLHSLLGRDGMITGPGVSFERRYGHEELARVFDDFRRLITEGTDEAPVQAFIEQHPVLLARFSARKIMVKPSILGKFQPDFATLDTRGVLTLIELERPALRLFKDQKPERGHAYADLNHAFQQVNDWLFETSKHRAAVLSGMELEEREVIDIRGAVIAGRTKEEERDYIRRQLFTMNQKLDFLTLDDLVDAAYQISRDLA